LKIKLSWLRLIALFSLSITLLAFELGIMRLFSVGSWSNFGSMVISICLLGFGLAGTLLTLIQKHILRNPNTWLFTTAFLMGPTMALAQVLGQQVPFNPVLISSDSTQLWWIAAYYVIYAVPFFLGALFIGIIFMSLSSKIHQLYFWNMLGSGIGGFVILLLMFLLPPSKLILPLLALAALTALLCTVDWSPALGRLTVGIGKAVLVVVVFAASFLLVEYAGQIHVSQFKPISYAKRFPDVREVYKHYSPMGQMQVFASSYFHFAPGLSDNASLNLNQMPRDAYLGLYTDGGGPVGIMRKLAPQEEKYIDYLPMSAPYLLLKHPNVLLLKMGGGVGIFTALYHGANHVDIAEPNPDLIHMMKDVPFFEKFNGELLRDPRVTVYNQEPRAYTASTNKRYNLVEISLIDSIGLSQAGGYPIDENYVYTVQGMEDYLKSLKKDGILSVTVWNTVDPPQNVPKLMTTIVQSLKNEGVPHPEKRIFAFDLLLSTATVLVKNSDFTPQQIQTLRDFCNRMSFDVAYYPGMPDPKGTNFDRILQGYQNLYSDNPQTASSTPATTTSKSSTQGSQAAQGGLAAQLGSGTASDPKGSANSDLLPGAQMQTSSQQLKPNDLYHYTLEWMLGGKAKQLYKKYIFDIRPATDNRPYYSAYMKTSNIGEMARHIGQVPEVWGQLLLFGTLLQSIIFGLIIIILPVVGRWRAIFSRRKGTLGVIVYFGALGLGYMMAEIYLMQRFVFFLADPIYSSSIVITTMLVFSGFGSLYSQRFRANRLRMIWIAVAGIAISVLFYLFLLSPVLNAALGLPLIVKILIAIALIAPAAFCLGIPFPTALDSLSENRRSLLPWAWGMNGALSVTGSELSRIVSISWGFAVVLVAIILVYIVAALVFKSNEIADERAG